MGVQGDKRNRQETATERRVLKKRTSRTKSKSKTQHTEFDGKPYPLAATSYHVLIPIRVAEGALAPSIAATPNNFFLKNQKEEEKKTDVPVNRSTWERTVVVFSRTSKIRAWTLKNTINTAFSRICTMCLSVCTSCLEVGLISQRISKSFVNVYPPW